MKKSSYDYYAERQNKISNFTMAKNVLLNLGFVFTAITLIVFGITQIADSRDNTIVMALPISIVLTLTCFLSIVPLNNKLRELRSKKRLRIKDTLINH